MFRPGGTGDQEVPPAEHNQSSVVAGGFHLHSAAAFMAVSASFLFLCDTIPTSMKVFPSGFFVTTSHFLVLALLATQYSVAAKAGRLHRDSIARVTTLRRNMVVLLGSLALSGALDRH